MKLINANSAAFIFILTCLAACQYKPEQQLITGSWKYISVTIGESDSSAMDISNNDYLDLNADSSFQYQVESLGRQRSGTWSYSDHTLHLHYDKPDTTRHFEIDVLTRSQLHFHEHDMVFKYSKAE
jgi:hypothetical protein